MPADTFVAYIGIYADVADADADYQAVKDLHEKADLLDAGQAGLVVVGVTGMQAKIRVAMRRSEKLQAKQLKADVTEIERDAKEAGTS